MKPEHYIKNRQKLLLMVHELHEQGFERLHAVPSLSPSGLSWRCEFVTDSGKSFPASNWLFTMEDEKEIERSPKMLAKLFSRENVDFLNECKGENRKYVEWYSAMVKSLKEGELPYAFADYFSPTDYWQTSTGNKIKTLPGETDFYFID